MTHQLSGLRGWIAVREAAVLGFSARYSLDIQ